MTKRPLTHGEKIALAIVAVLGIAALAISSAMDRRIDIDSPRQPDPATGRVYPEFVNHGHLRYVTQAEKHQFRYIGNAFMSAVAVALLTAFVIEFRRHNFDRKARKANENE
jgi:hypothetical protein